MKALPFLYSNSKLLTSNILPAAELPPGRRDVVDAVDGLEKDGVGESHLRDPESADDVGPAAVVGALEGAALVRAEAALDAARGRLQAAAAQPLALGDVGHAVTLLGPDSIEKFWLEFWLEKYLEFCSFVLR